VQAEVEAVVAMYTADQADTLLAGRPTFVFDAIDQIDTKVLGE
jgi:tRNA A37 threonylcarbamoyladenosine dehydratase